MEDTVFLVNQRASILDLSAVTDVTGRRVVLQPAGSAGARRECFADAEGHPHVQTMLGARWLRLERYQVQEAAAIAPATAVAPATAARHPVEPPDWSEEPPPIILGVPDEPLTETPPTESHEPTEAPGEQRRGKKRAGS
jgi:hypothetical protein